MPSSDTFAGEAVKALCFDIIKLSDAIGLTCDHLALGLDHKHAAHLILLAAACEIITTKSEDIANLNDGA